MDQRRDLTRFLRVYRSRTTGVGFGTLALAAMLLLVALPISAAGHGTLPSPRPFTASLGWSQISIVGTHPRGLWGASMAYDAADGYILLFGGINLSSNGHWKVTNLTWSYRGGVWSLLTPPKSPLGRGYATMVYDPARRSVVLFGGAASLQPATSALNDTWSFHHGTWTKLHPRIAPPARKALRVDLRLVRIDPNQHAVVLGGGFGFAGARSSYANESDEWLFGGGNWSQLPGSFYTHAFPFFGPWGAMAYSPAGRQLVYDGSCSGPGTWAFHNGSWTAASSSGGTALLTCSSPLVFDPTISAPIFIVDSLGSTTTWIFHHGNWSNRTSGLQPSTRTAAAAAFDASDGYLILFGGETSRGPAHDTWKLI
ncbi:MAG: hypothetical protein L3J96_03365 [Thermoplasmata archaeon]|nr:hypothetical protein [Thermoplasmata archaeon]